MFISTMLKTGLGIAFHIGGRCACGGVAGEGMPSSPPVLSNAAHLSVFSVVFAISGTGQPSPIIIYSNAGLPGHQFTGGFEGAFDNVHGHAGGEHADR